MLALKPEALELKFAECSDLQHLGGVDVLDPLPTEKMQLEQQ